MHTLRQISLSCVWTSLTRPMFLLLTKFSRHHSFNSRHMQYYKAVSATKFDFWISDFAFLPLLIKLYWPYYHWFSWTPCKCWAVSCGLLHWSWTSCVQQAPLPSWREGYTAQCPLIAETQCSKSPPNRSSRGTTGWSVRRSKQSREVLQEFLSGLCTCPMCCGVQVGTFVITPTTASIYVMLCISKHFHLGISGLQREACHLLSQSSEEHLPLLPLYSSQQL